MKALSGRTARTQARPTYAPGRLDTSRDELAPSPTRQSEKVRNELEDMIVSGEIAPGAKLDEESLAARFGVSRTPIREALMQLAATGLVHTRPRQTATVAKLTVKDIIESFEFNAEVEAIAADMAARRMTVAQRRALRAVVDRMQRVVRQGDAEAYVRLNRDFHATLHAGSHNRHVESQARILLAHLAPYRRQVLLRPGQLEVSLRQHREIANAVVAGDAAAASRAMRIHTSVNDQSFLDVLSAIARGHEE